MRLTTNFQVQFSQNKDSNKKKYHLIYLYVYM